MSCKCMSEVLEKAKANILGQLPKHRPDSFLAEWENEFFTLGGEAGLNHSVGLPIAVTYHRLKNNGQPYSHTTKVSINVFMSYCPFCGESQDDGGMQDIEYTATLS